MKRGNIINGSNAGVLAILTVESDASREDFGQAGMLTPHAIGSRHKSGRRLVPLSCACFTNFQEQLLVS